MKKHSVLRFVVDICLLFLFFFMLLLPVFLVTSIKIKDLDLRSSILKQVAGSHTETK